MSKDKIELRVINNQLHVGINGNGSVVLEDRMSDPHSDGLISTVYATVFHPSGHAHELGIQLSKSYNSTYGQNIAPEAVKDMYVALHDCDDSTSLSVCFRCLSDLLPKEETSWIEWLKKQGDIIDAAIEKATIK